MKQVFWALQRPDEALTHRVLVLVKKWMHLQLEFVGKCIPIASFLLILLLNYNSWLLIVLYLLLSFLIFLTTYVASFEHLLPFLNDRLVDDGYLLLLGGVLDLWLLLLEYCVDWFQSDEFLVINFNEA